LRAATSATNNLIELVPTSMTARRTGSMSHQTTKRDCGSPSEKMLHFADFALNPAACIFPS
jgi:hypothetical protein